MKHLFSKKITLCLILFFVLAFLVVPVIRVVGQIEENAQETLYLGDGSPSGSGSDEDTASLDGKATDGGASGNGNTGIDGDGVLAASSDDTENMGSVSKVIYLTFDDGPSYLTPRVLEVLREYDVKATFFVTGMNPQCAGYIRQAKEEGHTIGMHSYSHSYEKIYGSIQAYYEDLEQISNVCMEQIGYVPRYIRFPGGSSNSVSQHYCPGIMTLLTRDVQERGYRYYDWNAECGDGEGDLPAAELERRAESVDGINHIMLLCHDGNGKESTVEALPEIISFYQAHGYEFRAIDNESETLHHGVFN